MSSAKDILEASLACLQDFLSDQENLNKIDLAASQMSDVLKAGNKIIACGNGGSMSDAMHFAEELSGKFREDRKALAAIAISDPSYLSCVANDFGYDKVFSRFIEAIGHKGDLLLAISTSGNSANVIEAVKAAKTKGITCVILSGKDGGSLAAMADIEIRAPQSKHSDRAQEIHIKVIHSLIQLIEEKLFKN